MNRCGFEADIRFDIVYSVGVAGDFWHPDEAPQIVWPESAVVIDGERMPLTWKFMEMLPTAVQTRLMRSILDDQQDRYNTERQVRRKEEVA